MDGVGTKVRAGIKWTAMGLAATRVSKFAANIALARLLAVEVFGVVAIANAAITLMASLREAGLGQAYIQREPLEDERPTEAIDTVFVAMVVLNALLFCSMATFAPMIAGFFGSDAETVTPVLRALAVLFLLDSFVATPQFVLQRRMAFDKIARAQVVGSVSHAVLAIGGALAGIGVWALVLGQLGDRLSMALMLAKGARWRPGCAGSLRVGRGLLSYGKYLWGYSLVRSVGEVMDRVVVGKLYGTSGLGGYSQAFNLCLLPATLISELVTRVALPAMSRMQRDLPRLRAAFLKGLSHIAFLALPIGFGLYAVSELFVPVVYGEKWRFIVPIVNVLAAYGTVLALTSICGPTLQALGRPQVFFHNQLLRQATLIVLFVLLAGHGEVAVAWCVLGALCPVALVAFAIIAHRLEICWKDLLVPLLRSLLAAAGMALGVALIGRELGPRIGEVAALVVSILSGIALYPALSVVTNRAMIGTFLRTALEIRASRAAVR